MSDSTTCASRGPDQDGTVDIAALRPTRKGIGETYRKNP